MTSPDSLKFDSNDSGQKPDIPSFNDCLKLMEQGLYEKANAGLARLLQSYPSGEVESAVLQSTLRLYADAQRQTGHSEEAYLNYRALINSDPNLEAGLLRPIFHCLSQIRTPRCDPTFYAHLIQFIEADYTDTEVISGLVEGCLKQALHIDDENYEIELRDIQSNELLLAALPRLFLRDPEIEKFLNQLRYYLVSMLFDQGDIDISLVRAMALRAHNNEYVNFVTAIESELTEGLYEAIDTYCQSFGDLAEGNLTEVNLAGIEVELLVLAMYLPLTDFPPSVLEIEHWPKSCTELVRVMIINPALEEELKEALTSIKDISNEVSQSVQNQYELSPYPRWHSIHIRPQTFTYLDAYGHLKPLIENKEKFDTELLNTELLDVDAKLSCLVAGCGTGRHPITLAKNFGGLNILALDLSKTSLAYASRMARQFQAQNLEFLHGDILDLHKIGAKADLESDSEADPQINPDPTPRFDIIECIGVLHHMENPEAGLASLLNVLAPDGLLNLGLYSKVARREIKQLRDANITVGMVPTIENIREFRSELINRGRSDLLKSKDFYSASGCHDLLFHEQEWQFSLPELATLLEKHKLQFLGFHSLEEGCEALYREKFPEDTSLTNLKNWHEFECRYPNAFVRMYQFHCQKVS